MIARIFRAYFFYRSMKVTLDDNVKKGAGAPG